MFGNMIGFAAGKRSGIWGGKFMNAMNRLKKWISLQLEKMAKENQETFGGKVPDCCAFGRKSNEAEKEKQKNG
jgi:hypothetical protein